MQKKIPPRTHKKASRSDPALKRLIPVSEPNIGEKEKRYLIDAIESGWVSSNGPYLARFERNFAAYCGRAYGQVVSNGTVALHLALLALEIGPGDEVIVPNLSFVASANAVVHAGATPIFVDIEPDTLNIDAAKIKAKISPRTKAIMVVHLLGHPSDMDAIESIAREHQLRIIEDAAEAHGATYKGRMCGSFGDVSCFSFYGNKTITMGEGGICLTDDAELYRKINILRGQGMTPNKRYWHEIVGYNYRLTNIQAALGSAQLERIGELLKIKRANAKLYQKLLSGIAGVSFPVEKPYAKSSYWMVTIMVNTKKAGMSRDALGEELGKRGIETRILFYPISHLPPYKMNGKGLDVSESIAYEGLMLPSSTKLSSKDIAYICDQIKDILARK